MPLRLSEDGKQRKTPFYRLRGRHYANIFMGKFEKKHIYETIWNAHIIYYCRFIDDLFFIWNDTEHNLNHFFNHLNSVNNDIKFEYKYSKEKIDFLDVIILKDKTGNLSTDVHQKPTDTHSYLNRRSAHTNSCKNGIPYSQFVRLRRLCASDNLLKRRLYEYIEYFVNAGYSRKTLKRISYRALTISQTEALKEVGNEKKRK